MRPIESYLGRFWQHMAIIIFVTFVFFIGIAIAFIVFIIFIVTIFIVIIVLRTADTYPEGCRPQAMQSWMRFCGRVCVYSRDFRPFPD